MASPFKHLTSDEETRKLARGEFPVSKGPPKPSRQLAEIMYYEAQNNSYVVRTCGLGGASEYPGGEEYIGVPRQQQDSNNISPLAEGTMVILDHTLGFPYIAGVLNIRTFLADVENGIHKPLPVGGKSANVTPPSNTKDDLIGYYKNPNQPSDVIPGEWVQTSPEGNFIGVLREGCSMISGGPSSKAKIGVFGSHDLIKTTCADYNLVTDFGTLDIFNGAGRSGLSFKAAADQLTESGGEEQQWTFQLDIGDVGNFFDMQVLNADGKMKSRYHISPDGQVEFLAGNGLSLVNFGSAPFITESYGDVVQKYLRGHRRSVEDAAKYVHNGTRNTSISESDTLIVGTDYSQSVLNKRSEYTGNFAQYTFTGGQPQYAKKGNIAVETQVINGSYFMELGNTRRNANPLAEAGYIVAVNNGAITLGENPFPGAIPALKAQVNLNTTRENSIALGGTCETCTDAAVKYQALHKLLRAFFTVYDNHVHASPVGPPVKPISLDLGTMIPFIRSLRVLIGA